MLQTTELPSPEEMARFDAATIAAGTSSRTLMERAGQAVFQAIEGSLPLISTSRFVILCGPGNNGGDGFVIARLLQARRMKHLLVLASAKHYSEGLVEQRRLYEEAGGKVVIVSDVLDAVAQKAINENEIIVDALLGTGQKNAPRGAIKNIVEAALHARERGSSRIIAVDVPTGINADSGEVYEPAIKADFTISIERLKRGLLQYPARANSGELRTVAIGINIKGSEFNLLTKESAPHLPPRKPCGHKGDYGRVLVIAGSREMPGAAILSAWAALRTGAALVTVAAPGISPSTHVPELLWKVVPASAGAFALSSLKTLEASLRKSDVLVIGPGIGTASGTASFLQKVIALISKHTLPTVFDADALTLLSAVLKKGKKISLPHVVLTPHPGEMARLLDCSIPEVQRDRYAAVHALTQRINATVLLKGAASIVFNGAQGWVNSSGNPYMATGGSGDVLSGMIAGFIAQGLPLLEATKGAVYAHGVAGDLAHARSHGPILASDLIAQIPNSVARA